MRILGIESSSLVASVAVVTDDVMTAEYTVNFKKTHSQTLLPMIDEVVNMLGIELDSVDAIAVSGGPGSFTGLRIGSATAKGLCHEEAAGSGAHGGCHGLQSVWVGFADLPDYGRQEEPGVYGALPL